MNMKPVSRQSPACQTFHTQRDSLDAAHTTSSRLEMTVVVQHVCTSSEHDALQQRLRRINIATHTTTLPQRHSSTCSMAPRDAPMCVHQTCGVLCGLQAGAAEKGVPLYKYIAQLAGNSKLVRGAGCKGVMVLMLGGQGNSSGTAVV